MNNVYKCILFVKLSMFSVCFRRNKIFPLFVIFYTFICVFSGALQISDSQETDQGKYECIAENSVGTQHAAAIMLWVRGELKFFGFFFFLMNIFHAFCYQTMRVAFLLVWSFTARTYYYTVVFAENPTMGSKTKQEQNYKLKSHYFPFIC